MNNKEAIKQIEWVKKRISDITYSPESFEALNLAIKALEERPKGGWIPVSERLPQYSGLYIVSVDDVVTVANFSGNYFMHRGGGLMKVYAWMPLPQPYKEEAENDSSK